MTEVRVNISSTRLMATGHENLSLGPSVARWLVLPGGP